MPRYFPDDYFIAYAARSLSRLLFEQLDWPHKQRGEPTGLPVSSLPGVPLSGESPNEHSRCFTARQTSIPSI